MHVLVLGLGQYPSGSGIVTAQYLAKRGDDVLVIEPHYTSAMDANRKRLSVFRNVRVVTTSIDESVLDGIELVIRHQRLRRDEPLLVAARRCGIPIETELSIFLRLCPAPIIGITGTRGKSTTSALIHAILSSSKKWRHVWLAGNILESPLLTMSTMKAKDMVVLEMSSFQLEGTGDRGISPHIAVWTNLMRDHLNAYPSMEEYAEAKAQIFRHQLMEDIVFLPADASFYSYSTEAPGMVYRVGKKTSPEKALVASSVLGMEGKHNIRNAETAVAVALQLGVPSSLIKRVLKSFKGLSNRQEEIACIKGVRYINDTTATTPDATIAALETFSAQGKLHLIFGGADKELIFEDVAKHLKRIKPSIWVLPGTAHEKIAHAFHACSLAYEDVTDLADAIQQIRVKAVSGDIVLLSPGCASFGLFQNEYARGQVFVKLIKRMSSKRKK